MERGKDIWIELEKAIEMSMIAVIVHTHTHLHTHIKRGKKVLSPFIFGVVSFLP